ncbi:NifB/NifX family molybdenum-iron cluster-binding protein [Desulfospira joergensenii]|uniref:NifB/NifX family molybdenum-iron cluster-binding protein n=1 Tax=Desulfospira joergensenii TaxID=53329 RepID=UPI0003B5A3DC|nr:NifB/NifX family molybdenum-iron cluster-binding protein [Desulfospira joergensenii]
MKVAFPVKENKGLESRVSEHFGVAEQFLVVDLETRTCELSENQKTKGESVKCKTGVFAEEAGVDAVITKCLGDGSQRSLNDSNIKVFAALKETISENLELLEKGELKLFHMFDLCQGKKNKKEGGCGHHH